MKLLHLLLLFFMINSFAFGQQQKFSGLYFELAGSGGVGSFNFEKSFYVQEKVNYTWSTGLSLAPIDRNNGAGIVFPLMAHANIGKNAHKLELGLGQGITVTTKGSFFMLTTAVVGYRYQSPSKKWYYRIGYTPLISYLIDFQVQHWGGLSIGYTLKN
ncbi:MAG: hypothetical protein ACK46Y_17050 [Fluviicola sp.]